jgi:hypothetical protein
VCQEGLVEAKELDALWMQLCGSLGVPLHLLKWQLCGEDAQLSSTHGGG